MSQTLSCVRANKKGKSVKVKEVVSKASRSPCSMATLCFPPAYQKREFFHPRPQHTRSDQPLAEAHLRFESILLPECQKKHQRLGIKNAFTAAHKTQELCKYKHMLHGHVTLITVKCNIPELLLNTRRSCSSTTPLAAPPRLNLHFFISIPN